MAARLPIANRSGLEQCPEGFGVVAARFGYGLMVDLVVLPVFIILGGALPGLSVAHVSPHFAVRTDHGRLETVWARGVHGAAPR